MTRELLGRILVRLGYASNEQVENALESQRQASPPKPLLGSILIADQVLDEKQLAHALAVQMDAEVWDLETAPPDPDLKGIIPAALAQSCKLLPHSAEDGFIRCVAAGPLTPAEFARLEFIVNKPVRLAVASETELLNQIQNLYGVTVEGMIAGLSGSADDVHDDQEIHIHDLATMAEEPTLVNLVNVIISDAIASRASDIHIEPFENEIKIKYRIDGILQEMPPPPKKFQSAIVSRVKIMAGLDIAERYVPQDGQIRVNLSDVRVDIRVSTVPTIFGESVVLRLLNKDASLLDLKRLGLDEVTRRRFTHLLERSYGIILVCGPTGSGKTTTLYSGLLRIFTPEKKIITIEDPVEYQIHGVNQIPVRPKRGLTFASGLRSILRQDPDIIMVGEIRDRETADIAIRSALTGHLVFSTIHTNDAPGAVTRLLDMGVEPFLIASSLQGALGQRLVRRLCRVCRRAVKADPAWLTQFEVDNLPEHVYEPVGCEECRGTGYNGRMGIFELLTINEDLHNLILHTENTSQLKKIARGHMRTMLQDGWDKICSGDTSVAELIKVTQVDTPEGI